MELVLPLRVRPQPVPHLNAGGDCGPCVLAGLLGWSVPDVYARLREEKVGEIGYHDMLRLLRAHPELFDRLVEPPMGWSVYEVWRAWGQAAHFQASDWFRYVRMGMEAGYYGIANVAFRKDGPNGPGADHWVLLCGTRERRPAAGESGRIWQEVLVSCSAKSSPDEEWVDAHDFLRERGGFNLFLVHLAPAGANEKLARG